MSEWEGGGVLSVCEKARGTMQKNEAQTTSFHEEKVKPILITAIVTKVFYLLYICVVGNQK